MRTKKARGKKNRDSPLLSAVEQHFRDEPWGPGCREFRFHPTRQWRFDLAWPHLSVAFECEGGVWIRGRHTTGAGFTRDVEKYSVAVVLGWSVVRATVGQIESGEGILWLECVLKRSCGLALTRLAEVGRSAKTVSRQRRRRKV